MIPFFVFENGLFCPENAKKAHMSQILKSETHVRLNYACSIVCCLLYGMSKKELPPKGSKPVKPLGSSRPGEAELWGF